MIAPLSAIRCAPWRSLRRHGGVDDERHRVVRADEVGGSHLRKPARAPECDGVTLALGRGRDAAQQLLQASVVGHNRARRRLWWRFQLRAQPVGPGGGFAIVQNRRPTAGHQIA